MRKLIISLAAVILTAGIAIADETRISVGYSVSNQKEQVDMIDGVPSSPIESDINAWYLDVEGDEGDFLYLLSFGRGNQNSEASIAAGTLVDIKGEADTELTQALLGWHGLYWGEVGFGPAIMHRRLEIDDAELVVGGQPVTIEGALSGKTTFAGALLRTESDQFDFSAAVGIDAGSEGWDNGYGLILGADIHVSDTFTLTGGWQRAWGEYEIGVDVREDVFSLQGRLRIADNFFVEGGATRTNGSVGYDYSATGYSIGLGAVF